MIRWTALFVCCAATNVYAGGQLQLQLADEPGRTQLFPLDELTHFGALELVEATSGASDLGCDFKVGTETGATLVLDGVSYGVDALTVDGGIVKAVVDGETGSKCARTFAQKGTTLPLTFEIDVLALDGGQIIERTEVVELDGNALFRTSETGPGQLEITKQSDFLCLQLEAAPDQLALALTDTNGVPFLHEGIAGFEFLPPLEGHEVQNRVRAVTSDPLQCFAIPTEVFVQQSEVTAGAGGAEPQNMIDCTPEVSADVLFANRFEDWPVGAPLGTDLRIETQLLQNPTLPASAGGSEEEIVYRIEVANCGAEPSKKIRVRDFFATGLASQGARFLDGSWECIAGIGCPTEGGEGYLRANLKGLDFGEYAIFEARHGIDPASAFMLGEITSVTVAAFAARGDFDPSNNVRRIGAELLVTNNLTPTVATTGSFPTLLEDAGLVLLEGVNVTASDADGTIADISIEPASTADDDAIAQATFPQDLVSGSDIRFDLEPAADFFGTINLLVTATDDLGGTATTVVPVVVDPVNDAPRFTVQGVWAPFSETYTGTCDQDSAPGCASSTYGVGGSNPSFRAEAFPDWLIEAAPGPANETELLLVTCSWAGDDIFRPVVTLPSGFPQLNGVPCDGKTPVPLSGVSPEVAGLRYDLDGLEAIPDAQETATATITVRFDDAFLDEVLEFDITIEDESTPQ